MFKNLPKARLSRHFDRLNLISSGPGSLSVPQEVKSVELVFNLYTGKGHVGPKKFWRENLPRIQFYNPDLPIQVVRVKTALEEQGKVPALLKVNFQDGSSKDVDVKHKHSEEILQEFIKLTNAVPSEEIFLTPPHLK
jgi:large subunit ribosomal protein MRP49